MDACGLHRWSQKRCCSNPRDYLTANSLLNLLFNMLTPKSTPPKPHFSHCMTISQMLSLTSKYLAFAFLISVLPLIHLIMRSYFIISLVGLAYLLFLTSGSPHTCRLTHLPLPFHLIFLPHLLSLLVSRKALSLVPFFSIFILHLSVLSSSVPSSHTYSKPMTQTFHILHCKKLFASHL